MLTSCELARITREVGELVAGGAEPARLRSYGDAVGLLVSVSGGQASLSGFIGHSFFGSLSFNDLELPSIALRSAHRELREIAPGCAPSEVE